VWLRFDGGSSEPATQTVAARAVVADEEPAVDGRRAG
jgi:hypothetical protein